MRIDTSSGVEVINGATVMTGDGITAFQHLARYKVLFLECVGMTRRGASMLSIVKAEYNLKGSKKSVFQAFGKKLVDAGYLERAHYERDMTRLGLTP
jgi:hypothetical protein